MAWALEFQAQLVNSWAVWLWTCYLTSLTSLSFSDSPGSISNDWGGLNSKTWVWAQHIVSPSTVQGRSRSCGRDTQSCQQGSRAIHGPAGVAQGGDGSQDPRASPWSPCLSWVQGEHGAGSPAAPLLGGQPSQPAAVLCPHQSLGSGWEVVSCPWLSASW